MRIKKTISAESKIKVSLLMDRINLRLKEQGYIITGITSNSLSFKDDNWEIRSKDKIFKKVDKGEFELFESNDDFQSKIKYTYYVSFFLELIITIVVAIISFYQSFFILLILLPFLMQFITRIVALHNASNEFLAQIVD